MARYSEYDSDEERLPSGFTRVGYDADTQVYTYRDADGNYWEGASGCRYGQLTRVGEENTQEHDDSEPFLGSGHHSTMSWRTEMRPLLNFGVVIGLTLILLFWYLHWSVGSKEEMEPLCSEGLTPYTVQQGDTCWDIASKHDLSVDDLVRLNEGLDCQALFVDSLICLPSAPSDDTEKEDPVV